MKIFFILIGITLALANAQTEISVNLMEGQSKVEVERNGTIRSYFFVQIPSILICNKPELKVYQRGSMFDSFDLSVNQTMQSLLGGEIPGVWVEYPSDIFKFPPQVLPYWAFYPETEMSGFLAFGLNEFRAGPCAP